MNKCLITINLEDDVWMHDLLQQMCWKILDRKHIAIKSHQDVVEALSYNLEKMPNLRSFNHSFSKDLTEIPELTSASNLVKLNLESCTSLTRYTNHLGRSRMEMETLEAFLLSGCSKLEYVPEFGKNMTRLEHLYVDGTRIKKLPENLGEMRNLRLQSLPKLSLVDEDMDYGPRNRFHYHVSAEGVDVSKFPASSYNFRPTVSCLNCPRLAVDKHGSYVAEKLLNSYLEVCHLSLSTHAHTQTQTLG
ncbi:hypothetical protein L1987_80585 [Smallanthus sonchifolius]|uniref:Uncharacterized protein n=1 Tax=Smallanthus sonchifolius TaxID=185202 RepID=A0ACB8YNS3_9ASTR|nr:hypothetical protein L1987_80585 [Smallanthus sonchifolius]